jgi:hypothetical protein
VPFGQGRKTEVNNKNLPAAGTQKLPAAVKRGKNGTDMGIHKDCLNEYKK